jgi:ankyrin repeat protein
VTALQIACDHNNLPLVSLLLERGAHSNLLDQVPRPVPPLVLMTQHQFLALHKACRRGHTELATVLLDCGANVNRRNPVSPNHVPTVTVAGQTGLSPLHLACVFGNAALVSVLLSRGANVVQLDLVKTASPLHSS